MGLFPMKKNPHHQDALLGADLFDIFDGSDESISTTSTYDCTTSQEEEVVLGMPTNQKEEVEMEVEKRKPVSFKVSNKAPRHRHLHELDIMHATSTTNTSNSEEDPDSGSVEEEAEIHPQLQGPAARKSPYYQRRTKEQKARLMKFLLELREVEESRLAYQKLWSNLSLSIIQLKESGELPTSTEKKEVVGLGNLLDGFNTRFLNYSLLTPLLFQNQLKVETFVDGQYQCHKMSTDSSTIINIRVRL